MSEQASERRKEHKQGRKQSNQTNKETQKQKKRNTIKERGGLSIKTRLHEKILICLFRRGILANFYVINTFAEKLAC